MTIPLPTVSPRRSSCQPGPLGRWHPCGRYRRLAPRPDPARGPYLALLRVGLAVPVLLPVPRWALTPPFHLYRADPKANPRSWRGSLFSVALSLGLPPPGVTRHPCQRESGLSSERCRPAVIQPSARGQLGIGTGRVNRNRPQACGERQVHGVQQPRRPGAKAKAEGSQQRLRGGLGITEGAQVGHKARPIR